jgi:hypothetical protein
MRSSHPHALSAQLTCNATAAGLRTVLVTAVVALSMALTSCAHKNPATLSELGAPIASGTDRTTAVATIESIDAPSRSITLKNPSGTTSTIRCGSKVVNFDQFRVGDHVKAVMSNEMAIFVPKPGQLANAEVISTVQRPPRGSKPGLVVTDSTEVNAQVGDVDPDTRTIILSDVAGKSRSIALQPGANLSAVRSGDRVIMRCTQTISIVVTDAP